MVQRSSIWLLDIAMARLVMGLKLWRLCAEGRKRYTQALYLSAGFGDFKYRGYMLSKKPRFKKSKMRGICPSWMLW
jgi:hypothetical protein